MAKGNLKLVIQKKPDPVVTQVDSLVSVRGESNAHDIIFSHSNLNPVLITEDQVLYTEGIPGDSSQTYIVVTSQYAQNITSTGGNLELHVVSNGKLSQLDKTINILIGGNTFPLFLNFESRPDTADATLTADDWTKTIKITKQFVLDNCSDFDGSEITDVGVECGSATNFTYDGQPYVSGTLLPLIDLDSKNFIYTPDENNLGYTVEYPWIVKDITGLVTTV